MTDLPGSVLTLLYRQVHTLLPGLVVALGLLVAGADLLPHSLALLLVAETHHYHAVATSEALLTWCDIVSPSRCYRLSS